MNVYREKLEQYARQAPGPRPHNEVDLSAYTDDELVGIIAQRFGNTPDEAAEMVKDSIRADQRWERTRANQEARAQARRERRPSRNMTLEQALERAKELERERMELVAFINTIPDEELGNVERLTGMWARPNLNSDSGYTLSKLVKIFKLVLKGRQDPAAMQRRLESIGYDPLENE